MTLFRDSPFHAREMGNILMIIFECIPLLTWAMSF